MVSQNASSQSSIVFVDGALRDAFAEFEANANAEVIYLDAEQDGVAQISAALAGRSDLASVQIFSHGSEGHLQLGDTHLSNDTLGEYAEQIAEWNNALSAGGDLLLFGCDVAGDAAGQALVQQLSQLTGADVAASTDLTGNADLGGDWELEYTTGLIEAPLAFQLEVLEAYTETLRTYYVATGGELRDAINSANATAGEDTIYLTDNIAVANSMEIGDDLTIRSTAGNQFAIDGQGKYQIFSIEDGSGAKVTLQNLTLEDGLAQGGDGVGNGGGGLGAGGALFVGSGSDVLISNVSFIDNSARGGSSPGTGPQDGDGERNEDEDSGDPHYGNFFHNGFDYAEDGGGGGRFNGVNSRAPGGQTGRGQEKRNGGDGGFGGGGGGGGGGSDAGFGIDFAGLGGDGGFGGGGGGGGGAGWDGWDGWKTLGGQGGAGGEFGGNGQAGARGDGHDHGDGGQGGGGAGLGGAIFVNSGATLTLLGVDFSGNTTAGGTGHQNGQAEGDNVFLRDGANLLHFASSYDDVYRHGGSTMQETIPPLPQASVTVVNHAQEPAGHGLFRISLSEAFFVDTTVLYTVGGEATAGSDYTPLLGSAVIRAGQTTVDVPVYVQADTLDELNETVTLTLKTGKADDGHYYSLDAGKSEATLTIHDADIRVVPVRDAIEGGQAGQFEVRLSQAAAQSLTFDYTLGGTAQADSDYHALNGQVTFTAGETSKIVTVNAINDNLLSGDETLTLTLNPPAQYALKDGESAATLTIREDEVAPQASLSLVQAPQEGSRAAQFRVQLATPAFGNDSNNGQPGTWVYYTLNNGTAESNDYSDPQGGRVFIRQGQSSATVTLPIADDWNLDPNETFTVQLGNHPSGQYLANPSQDDVTFTIADNDVIPQASLNFKQTPQEGGNTAQFEIELATPALNTETHNGKQGTWVYYTLSNGSAESADYTAPAGKVFIEAGQTRATVDIAITDDIAYDPNETFTVRLASHPSGRYVINSSQDDVTFTIVDNDVIPTATLQAVRNPNEAGEQAGQFRVQLATPALEGGVTVEYEVVGGTATAGSDYTAPKGSVFIAAGQTEGIVTIAPMDDRLYEPDETITLRLKNPSNGQLYTVGTQDETTLTINNDDHLYQVSLSAVNDAEEASAAGYFKISLDQPAPDGGLELTYRVAGDAAAETDYLPLGSSVTVAAGQTEAYIRVQPLDNQVTEGDRAVTLTFDHTEVISEGLNYTVVSEDSATLNILDDDTAGVILNPLGTVTSESGNAAEIEVRLTSRPTEAVTVTFTSDTLGEGTLDAPSVTFLPEDWQTGQVLTVRGVDDAVEDGDQGYQLTAAVQSGDANYDGFAVAPVQLTNLDDDGYTLLVSDPGRIAEGETTTYTIGLSQAATEPIPLEISANPQTEISLDGVTFSDTLLTNLTDTTLQTITVRALDDTAVEGLHTGTIRHRVLAHNDPNYASEVDVAAAAVVIEDNDTSVINIVQVEAASEESLISGRFSLALEQPAPAGGLTINYTVSAASTATEEGGADPDFYQLSRSVYIPAGQTGVDVVVLPVQNSVAEGPEQLEITLAEGSGYTLGSQVTDTLTIYDDDVAGVRIRETGNTSRILENVAGDQYTIELTSQPTDTVVIDLVPTGGMTLNQTQVVFTPGDWNKPQTITLDFTNDNRDQGDRAATIQHTISSSDSQYANLDVADVDVAIFEDDAAGIRIRSTGRDTAVVESGASDTYSVVLESEPLAPVTVNLLAPDDVTLSNQTLTFDASNWDQVQTVTVSATQDDIDKGDRDITIRHSVTSADTFYSSLTLPSVTVNITEDDQAGVTIAETGADTEVTIGDKAGDNFSIQLGSRPTSNVTVTFTGAEGESLEELEIEALEITPDEWDQVHDVNVLAAKGVGGRADDIQVEMHFSSDDANYDGITVDPVSVDVIGWANIFEEIEYKGLTLPDFVLEELSTRIEAVPFIHEASAEKVVFAWKNESIDIVDIFKSDSDSDNASTSIFANAKLKDPYLMYVMEDESSFEHAKYGELDVSSGFVFFGEAELNFGIDFGLGEINIAEYLTDQLGIDNSLGIYFGIDSITSPENILLKGFLDTDISFGSDLTLDKAWLEYGVEFGDEGPSPSLGVYGDLQLEDPALLFNGGVAFGVDGVTGAFSVSADNDEEEWVNPFGIPDVILRNIGVEFTTGYTGKVLGYALEGDMQIGDIDAAAAFGVDYSEVAEGGLPAYELSVTANEEIHLVDAWMGVGTGFVVKQIGKELTFVNDTLDFIKDVIDVTAISIDSDDDGELDPLFEIGDGLAMNAQVNAWGQEASLVLEVETLDPTDIATSLEEGFSAELTLSPIDLGFFKLSGADNKYSDFTLAIENGGDGEISMATSALVEILGVKAQGNVDITPSSFSITDLEFSLFDLIELNVTEFVVEPDEGKVALDGSIEIGGITVLSPKFSLDSNGLSIEGFIGLAVEDLGELGMEVSIQLDSDGGEFSLAFVSPVGEVELIGVDIENFNPVYLATEVAYEIGKQAIESLVTLITDPSALFNDAFEQAVDWATEKVKEVVDTVESFANDIYFGVVGQLDKFSSRDTGLTDKDDTYDAGRGNDFVWGKKGDDTISGGSGNDKLHGDEGDDVLYGGDGNDNIKGESYALREHNGDDTIFGGSGNDTMRGYDGNDYIKGDSGNDKIYGGDDRDHLIGNRGDDQIYGGNQADVLEGGSDDDYLNGGAGDDYLYGNSHSDRLYGGAGRDYLDGGTGNDYLNGETGNDIIYGGDGRDKLYGGTGHDELYGGTGHDELYGGTGNDLLAGGSGNDNLEGNDGDDGLFGESGDDTLKGGEGVDKLLGGAGDDSLEGGNGNDELSGGSGNDILKGDYGHDTLDGDDGDDTLYGGVGNDVLKGGFGSDTLHAGSGDDILDGSLGGDDDVLYGDTEGGKTTFILQDDGGTDTVYNFGAKDTLKFISTAQSITIQDFNITSSGGNQYTLSFKGDQVATIHTQSPLNESDLFSRLEISSNLTGLNQFRTASGEMVSLEELEQEWFERLFGTRSNKYVAGSLIFFDANFNGLLDDNEAFAFTDEQGRYQFGADIAAFDTNNNQQLDPEEGQYVATGGIDTYSGQIINAVYTAPATYGMITPVTTLVNSLVQYGQTVTDAENKVKQALGLSDSVDLGSFDAIAGMQAGDPEATKLMAAHVAIHTVLEQATSLAAEAFRSSEGEESGAAFDSFTQDHQSGIGSNILSVLVEQMSTGSTFDLTNADFIHGVLSEAIDLLQTLDLGATADWQKVSDMLTGASQIIAQGVQITNDVLNQGGNIEALLTEVGQVQAYLLSETTQQLSDAIAGKTSISEILSNLNLETIFFSEEAAAQTELEVVTFEAYIQLRDVHGMTDGWSQFDQTFGTGVKLSTFFDEAAYLAENQDVALAVQNGSLASGFGHFSLFGFREGRDPSILFDEAYYLANNADVKAAVAQGALSSGFEHFLNFGLTEGRSANDWFDEDDYLLHHRDVNAAVNNGLLNNGFQHYLSFGIREGRLSSMATYAMFDEASYLQNNPDVQRAVQAGVLQSGLEHYAIFGQREGRNAGDLFSASDYLESNPDVAAAVANSSLAGGFTHYLLHGRVEGRALV
ncbi:MAG: DUF4347 domain-containing protein [Cyanobacteria bacterium P01_H01_bin.162]